MIEEDEEIIKIGTGVSHSGCLTTQRLYVWGTSGRITSLIQKKPNYFPFEEKIKNFVMGDNLTVILTTKGEVFTMGENIDF